MALCSVVMTAGVVAVAGLEDGGAAGGGGAGKKPGGGGGGGGEDGGGDGGAVALGVDADDGVRRCAYALRRLVLLGLSTSKSKSGDGSGKSGDGPNTSCCCAGLYVALLLRGSRFDVVADVVGDILGGRTAPPPLSGPEGMDALEALRDAAVAASESESPCPPPSSSSSPRLRASFTSRRPRSAASTASSSPSVSPRGGPVTSRQRGATAAVPPLSLNPAVPANSSRARPRAWSVGSGGGLGTEAAAAAAAATSLAEENRAAAAAAAAGGGGWFSEAALADCVKALPPCAGAGLGAIEPAGGTAATATATASGAGAVHEGAARWRYGPVDCVEEALEQVCLVRRLGLVGGCGGGGVAVVIVVVVAEETVILLFLLCASQTHHVSYGKALS